METRDTLRTTPLTGWHRARGAKLAPFAGFEMPIQYEAGILAEHAWTRTKASAFDICHMGEFFLTGENARRELDRLVTQDLSTLAPGKCRYGFLLNEAGGVLDDLIVYCLAADEYMLVVNGSREASDFAWISERIAAGPSFENRSEATAKIDVQGPLSLQALSAALGPGLGRLAYFNFLRTTLEGVPILVSRTGYTGELGYELYLPAERALWLWDRLLAQGSVRPAGLGARDTMRLELGYTLYGQDLDENHTPIEAGYGHLLTKQSEFIGRSRLAHARERLVGLAIPGRRSARCHDPVFLPSGEPAGTITSGSFAPSLGHCVALAYVQADLAEHDRFLVRAARVELEARRADPPFYRQGTARVKTA